MVLIRFAEKNYKILHAKSVTDSR